MCLFMQFMAAVLFVLSAVYAVYAVYAISSLDLPGGLVSFVSKTAPFGVAER